MNQFYIDMQNYIDTLIQAGAKIGKHVFIGHQVYIETDNTPLLTIENETVISAFCKFILHDSSLNNISSFPIYFDKIILKQNCYIGADTTILPGTTIGKNTIVGAGSLVKGLLKANSVYFGRPAQYYCSINQLKKKWKEKQKNKIGVFIKSPKWYKGNNRTQEKFEKAKKTTFYINSNPTTKSQHKEI